MVDKKKKFITQIYYKSFMFESFFFGVLAKWANPNEQGELEEGEKHEKDAENHPNIDGLVFTKNDKFEEAIYKY